MTTYKASIEIEASEENDDDCTITAVLDNESPTAKANTITCILLLQSHEFMKMTKQELLARLAVMLAQNESVEG